jgi:uncharacterized membrane protein YgdD (TMEM256/DUF423 family)
MVMNNIAMITGTLFGILGVILGAFGAHALKKILSEDKLASFEIGVKYQMYTAFFLLILGNLGDFGTSLVVWSYYLVTIGTILFSFSIYLLSLANYLKRNFRFLGPITPLGGLFMILGWSCLLISLF